MPSDCTAAMPQSLCAYTWKEGAASYLHHPALPRTGKTGEAIRKDSLKAEHPAISWKAYLASRDFQNLASDLAEAFFSENSARPAIEAERPEILSYQTDFEKGGRLASRVLAAGEAVTARFNQQGLVSQLDLPIAA